MVPSRKIAPRTIPTYAAVACSLVRRGHDAGGEEEGREGTRFAVAVHDIETWWMVDGGMEQASKMHSYTFLIIAVHIGY